MFLTFLVKTSIVRKITNKSQIYRHVFHRLTIQCSPCFRQTNRQTDGQTDMYFPDLLSKCSPCFIRNCDPCSHCLSRSCSREAGKSLKTQTGHPLGHGSSIRSSILLSRLLSDYMLTRYLTTTCTSEAFLSPWVFFLA